MQAHVLGASREILDHQLTRNTFLMKDGAGPGEGLVLWLPGGVRRKIVRNEFVEENRKIFDAGKVAVGGFEVRIVDRFLTESMLRKTAAKVGGVDRRRIPELLELIWHDFVTEDLWEILREYRNDCRIDFRLLHDLVVRRSKKILADDWFS